MDHKYSIDYDTAIDLIRFYLEEFRIYERSYGVTPKQFEHWNLAQDKLANLLLQLKLAGHNTDIIIASIRDEMNLRYSFGDIVVNIDGAARGNGNVEVANSSGVAFIVYDDKGNVVTQHAEYLGSHVELRQQDGSVLSVAATNNVSEYVALIRALEYLVDSCSNARSITVKSDSDTVVQQVNLTNTTRAPHLIKLRDYALSLVKNFSNLTLVHIPREENTEADALINKVLDEVEKVQK